MKTYIVPVLFNAVRRLGVWGEGTVMPLDRELAEAQRHRITCPSSQS